ncbi:MAG: aldehyde dehydrogenase family protein [Ignavibacteriales bacterium]|nr:aldehyde dehydrogenase family protein [Ignavibacteriales bacterium]
METTISYNPATGEKIGETPLNTVEELNKAVQKAKIAQQKWAQLSFKDRRDIILKMRIISRRMPTDFRR